MPHLREPGPDLECGVESYFWILDLVSMASSLTLADVAVVCAIMLLRWYDFRYIVPADQVWRLVEIFKIDKFIDQPYQPCQKSSIDLSCRTSGSLQIRRVRNYKTVINRS